ncbi:MAG: hypothetical protein LPJ94_09890 [Thauera sp.]|nr:hypothetical protein [Thauera sp.]
MHIIIAGHFAHVEHLNEATAELDSRGFARENYAAYFLNPPGQHGLYVIGGDAQSDEGTRASGKTASAAAVAGGAAGAVVGSPAGPIGALAGAGVGAYLGAFIGALKGTRTPDPEHATRDHPAEPPGGPMLAVRVDNADTEAAVVDIFDRCQARQIDRTHGEWRDGSWLDFDPRKPIETLLSRGEGQ